MSNSKAKRAIGRRAIFLAIFIVSLIVIMVAVSFSWYYIRREVTVSEFSIEVVEANNLVIRSSEDDRGWSKLLIMQTDEDFAFGAVAGNGTSFFAPRIELVAQDDGKGEYSRYAYEKTGYIPLADTEHSQYLFAYDFSVSIENEHDLCLMQGTTVATQQESTDPTDHASAALRVALLVKENGTYHTALIWIPDVQTQLIEDKSSGNWYVNTEDPVPETSITLVDAQGKDYSIEITGTSGHMIDQSGVTYVWGDITEQDLITVANLPSQTEKEFRLVVWVDGNDRDCNNSIMGGNVFVDLKFTAAKATE